MKEQPVRFAERPENLPLRKNADQALNVIAQRLEAVRAEFGTTDFPEDNGIAFRNEFFKFPIAFLASELQDPDEENDKVFFANYARLRLCAPHQLMYLAGVVHMKALTYSFLRSRPKEPLNWETAHFQWLAKRQYWIRATYDLGQHFTQRWHDACKLPWDEANDETESLLYSEVARTIGVDPEDKANKGSWSGMALMCLIGHDFSKWHGGWEHYCEDVFR